MTRRVIDNEDGGMLGDPFLKFGPSEIVLIEWKSAVKESADPIGR